MGHAVHQHKRLGELWCCFVPYPGSCGAVDCALLGLLWVCRRACKLALQATSPTLSNGASSNCLCAQGTQQPQHARQTSFDGDASQPMPLARLMAERAQSVPQAAPPKSFPMIPLVRVLSCPVEGSMSMDRSPCHTCWPSAVSACLKSGGFAITLLRVLLRSPSSSAGLRAGAVQPPGLGGCLGGTAAAVLACAALQGVG